MWQGQKVSVVFPTYNEKDSIRAAIEDFFASGVVDEIVVVNNNAAPGTSEEVAGTRAREVHEPRQGYGAAIRRGLSEATGDLLVVAEPDGTFLGRDVFKLLAYAQDFDVVYGSRTGNDFIWDGANMGPFLRWGNWAVAKLMEVLFNATSLTDVGCTVRLLKRAAYERLAPHFTVDGNFFGPEMMLLSIQAPLKIVQIPVNYLPRVGESSVTGSFRKAFWLGLRMIALILEHRFKRAIGWAPGERRAAGTIPVGVGALLHLALLMVFVAFAGSHLRETFVIDEMDFPALGRAVAHTGLPLYYRGEDRVLYPGIYHVPFYGYALGGWLWIFGDSIAAVRSFTLVCAVAAWGLGLRLLRQACRALGVSAQLPGLLYSLVLLTSAYWIQSAVLPDIDGTTLIVACLASLTLLVDWMEAPTWRRALACTVALAVCLLSKLTTTLGIVAVIVPAAAFFAARRRRRAWLQAAVMVGGAVALFLGTWGAVASLAHLDFGFPFVFTVRSATKGTAGGGRLASALANLRNNRRQLAWWGPGLTLAIVAGLAGTCVLAWRRVEARGHLAVLGGAAAIVFAIYALIIGPVFWFSKYYVVAMPVAAAGVSLTLAAGGAFALRAGEYARLGVLLAVGVVWMAAVERDAALVPFAPSRLGLAHPWSPAVVAALVAACVLALLGAVRQARIGAAGALLAGLVVAAAAQGIGTAWAQVGAPYATRYYYGERGLDETAALLRRETAPGEVVFASKDVGLAAGRPFFEDAEYVDWPARFDALLRRRPPRLVVFRRKFDFALAYYPRIEEIARSHGYRPWRDVGDFAVWRQEGSASR